jgi:Protein kinase domain
MTTNGPAVSAHLPRPGDTIAGKYVLERLLGQGGMGAVFAARHVKLSKAVAIKIMLADRSNPEAAARFVNEGRAAANIQNDHVVRVDDVDEEKGYAYMVLELLEGEDLGQLLDRELTKRLAPHLAVTYVMQALRGVAQAHAIGIVHRDLKPSNLFLAKRPDGPPIVKVLDFGISKSKGSSVLSASPSALTSTAAMLGSPLYMSPEQLRRSKSVDHHCDLWAMGVILYELMTGVLPFGGESLGELFAAILETPPTPLRERVDGVHPRLDAIVMRCLEKLPEHRFHSAGELAHALAPYGAPVGSGDAIPVFVPPAPSGAMPVVGRTVALGAITPMPGLASAPMPVMQQSGSGWQHSSAHVAATPPKSKVPLVVGLGLGAMVLVGGGLIVFSVLRGHAAKADPGVATAPPSAASVPALPASAPVASASATVAVADPDPPASATASAPGAAGSAPVPTAPTVKHVSHGVPQARPEPPRNEPKPEPPKPDPPKPKPPPTNNGGNLQNAR